MSYTGVLLNRKIQLVDINGVRRSVAIAVQLIVDSDAIRAAAGRVFIVVDGCGLAVQGDRLIEQLIRWGALHLDDEMVPGATQWIAGHARRKPVLIHVIPNIPLVPTGNAALMSPDETLP